MLLCKDLFILHHMTDRALIIFIRNPEWGKVKTRIAAEAGEDLALDIYQKLLGITRDTSLGVDCVRYLYATDALADDRWPAGEFVKKIQDEGDLGNRMRSAIREVLTEAGKAVIMGSDCPWLTAGTLGDAFDRLDEYDLVIGPARDGGYYLLGMKALHESLFEGISWSSEKVLEETLMAAEKSGLSCFQLEMLSDVDHLQDWQEYEQSLFRDGDRS